MPPSGPIGVYGKVTDSATGAPLRGICVTLGQPGAICWAITDINGNFTINAASTVEAGSTFQLYFFTCRAGVRSLDGSTCVNAAPGYAAQSTDLFPLSVVVRKDWSVHK